MAQTFTKNTVEDAALRGTLMPKFISVELRVAHPKTLAEAKQ